MKRLLYPVFCFVISLLSVGCSASRIAPVNDSFPDFNLTGQWAIAGTTNWQNEIMFDFRPDQHGSFELKVWGQPMALDSVQVGESQFIFSYQEAHGPKFYVLGSILSHDQVKLSRVQEAIDGFQPVGKLGEKVYYLKRIYEGEPYMLTKASSLKRETLRRYK